MANPPYNASNVNRIVASCITQGETRLPPDWQKIRQLFGLYRDDSAFGIDTVLTRNEPFLQSAGAFINAVLDAPTWWTVQLYGLEFARTPTGPGLFLPQDRQNLINVGRPCTRMKARIITEDMDVPRSVDVDIGAGIRLAVDGCTCRVELLTPTIANLTTFRPTRVSPSIASASGGFVETSKENQQQQVATGFNGGLVLDVLLAGSITPCWAPIGDRFATLTYRVAVPSGPVVPPIPVIQVPPGAKRVTIYNEDPLLRDWEWYETLDAAGVTGVNFVDSVQWGTGPAPNVVTLPVPGVGCVLQGPPGPSAEPYFATVVWHLEW